MPLIFSSEYSAESFMADLPLQRARRNQLEIQLITLQEGLAVDDSPVSRSQPLQTYTVSQFQTLPMISSAVYNVPDHWMAIAEANNIQYPYTVVPGQILKLPEVSRAN